MKPYRVFDDLRQKEFKDVLKWEKKHRKFGVYLEVEERPAFRESRWLVRVFCPPIYTDILGNSAIKEGFTFMAS